MARYGRKRNVWYIPLLVAMVVLLLCIVGYINSQNITCGGYSKTWVWASFPPKYECRPF